MILDREEFADSDFEALGPRLQRLMFAELRTEIEALRDFKRNVTEKCPQIDTMLYQNPPMIPCIQVNHRGEDGYAERVEVRRAWTYKNPDIETLDDISWGSSDLIADSPKSELRLRKEGDYDKPNKQEKDHFAQRISSQLLLYRVACIFGVPASYIIIDDTKPWRADLFYQDGCGEISLYDSEGHAVVEYDGSYAAVDEALKLINFLCGMRIPYGHGGAVAGVPWEYCSWSDRGDDESLHSEALSS